MSKTAILLITLLVLCSTARAYDFPGIAEWHILPVYRTLVRQTAALDTAAQTYCAQPTPAGREDLQTSYRAAFLAWQGAQHLRFGPVQYLSREHRFAFWPDKRGVVGRHLGRLLKAPALQHNDFDISQKSVAVQGLSALERLLFTEQPVDAAACRIVVAIGANLHEMAAGLLDDWNAGEDPYIGYFSRPGGTNPVFESASEAAGRLLNGLYTQLESIVTLKLANPLGSGIEKARGKRAEGWRSQSGLPAIAANLEACRALYRQAFAPELAGEPLDAQIEAGFSQARQTLDKIAVPLAQAVGDSAQRALVEQLQTELSQLKRLFARELTAALGLSLGFNSLDGD